MKQTNFERAIFFSWHCDIRDCKFCYMSTQPENKGKIARRSTESLLAEVLITKRLGWDFGFFSGGMGAFDQVEFFELLKKVYSVYGEKIWINVGPLEKERLLEYEPYIKGVVGSIETVNKQLHDKICPSKPVQPYLDMFLDARELGLDNAVTIILGLGESIDDFRELRGLITDYNISKIHFYSLNPHKGTIFEGKEGPSAEYQAEWIKKTREAFPDIDIQCGIWGDRADRVGLLLKAGANSISKFPALKAFGTEAAKEIERQAELAGFEFKGSLTRLPDIDWDGEVDKLGLDDGLKEMVKVKLRQYIRQMSKK